MLASNGDKDGHHPEEIAMMPKKGWEANGKVNEEEEPEDVHCGFRSWRPPFLQKFSGLWTFIIVLGLSSLGSEYMHVYLKGQLAMLRRQFDLEADSAMWMVNCSENACIFGALFLSIFARRIHIPRVLAVTSAVCGFAGLLCIIPHFATHDTLVPVRKVAENETYSIERYQLMGPSCLANPKAMETMKKLMMEEASKMSHNAAPSPKAGKPSGGPNVVDNSPKQPASVPKVSTKNDSTIEDVHHQTEGPTATDPPATFTGRTVTIPDFKKLATHPNFESFVVMSKPMGIDLVAVSKMSLKDQIEYVDNLPPKVKAMLPNMKLMLGDNADSYFITVQVPEEDDYSMRRKRSVRKGRINLETDLGYSGQLAKMMKMMPPIKPEIMEKAFKLLCPFNSGPFHEDVSSGALTMLYVAMAIQGFARAPRIAFAVTFLADNTQDTMTSLPLGVLLMISMFGPMFSILLTFFVNQNYITLEDVGAMTMFNPRWLPAWWIGFIILAVYALVFAVPLFFFPQKLKRSNKYTVTESSNKSSPGVVGYFKDLLMTLFRLCTNPVYLCLILGSLLTCFCWVGFQSVLVPYVTHQFAQPHFLPGSYLLLFFTFFIPIGVVIGGIVSTKLKLSSLGNLKFVIGLACALVIIQGCHLGIGCKQPVLDKGLRMVQNISTTDNCSATCPCNDLGYNPGCGSDGRTYYSPCHAGCGEGYDGKYHDCKCIEDSERTVTPGFCPDCNLFYPFCLVLCIGAILFGMMTTPLLIATYRSVKWKDIPMAIGFHSVLAAAVVFLPSPAVYQRILDAQCSYRRPECGVADTCAIYDIESTRLNTFGLSLGLTIFAALLFFAAYILGRKSTIYHQVSCEDQVKT